MYKSIPTENLGDHRDAPLTVRDLWTPVIVVAQDRVEHNARFMSAWTGEQGLELMPHGKTTMAPELWRFQVREGAAGITVATPWQLRVAVESGIDSVQLANQLTDPHAIRWLASTLAEHRAEGQPLQVWSWIDDVRTVGVIEAALEGFPADAPQLQVLVDLGRPTGRTGARSMEAAREVADAVVASPRLRLAGVAGYEGALAHTRDEKALQEVRGYLEEMVQFHDSLADLYDDGEIVVTAGGSAYPDMVGEVFGAALANSERHPARYVLRSGAYLVHDDGFYRGISPFEDDLVPAVRGLARVISQPQPGLALLDAGKRDFPFDEGLPVPLAVLGDDGQSVRWLDGAEVTALNDQHTFMTVPDGTAVNPGDVVVLGLSHPCTMFDKWKRIPVIESFEDGIPAPSATVVDWIETNF